MPGGIGVAIATGLGMVTASGSLTTAGLWVAIGVEAALLVGATYASTAMAKQDMKQTTQPRDVVVRSGNQPKQIVYGEATVAGILAYMNQRDVSNDDFELWAAVVHAAHECTTVLGYYYESDYIELGTELIGGEVVSGPWYAEDSGGEHAAKISTYLGTSTQTANADFVAAFDDITTDFRLRGYTYSLHRWRLWQGSEEIFKGGEPSNIRAHLQGKQIYDPRLDTSPGANPDNVAYFAYSKNPILIAADYMRNYWSTPVPAARFDWTWLDAQADICDASVSTPGGTEPRYECSGLLSLGDSGDTNLGKILACCLGFRSINAGLIRFSCGDSVAASVSLDETDIVGPVKVRTSVAREKRYNRVAGTFYSEDAGWTMTEFQPQENSNYVTRDNGFVIPKQIALSMVTQEYAAQRIAFKHLNQSEHQVSAEIPLRWSGLRLSPGEYVSITLPKFSWSSKLFRVESLKIGTENAPIIATVTEDSASSWDDPLVGDYTTRSSSGEITKPISQIPVCTSLTANEAAFAGQAGILLEWVNPSTGGARTTWDSVNIYASPTSAWSSAVLIASNITNAQYWHSLPNNTTRYYWLRTVRNGIESDREPNSDTSNRTANSGDGIDAGATDGGTLGDNIWNEASELLLDIDVRNDQAVTDELGSINANPSMQMQADRGSFTGPASWATSDPTYPYPKYENDAVRDVLLMETNDYLLNSAIQVNPNTQYEISALVKFVSTPTNMDLLVHYYLTATLPSGRQYIGTVDSSHGTVNGDGAVVLVNNQAVGTSYELITGIYTPNSLHKWFSPCLYNNGSLNDYLVEWCVVRERSTYGADWNTNLINIPPQMRQIFYQSSTPSSTTDGDYWIDTDDGSTWVYQTGTSWIQVTDQQILDALDDAATAQATADGKIYAWAQSATPTADGVGDIWLDTGNGNILKRWNGSAWVTYQDADIATAISDSSNALALADSKIVTFYQDNAPTATSTGDLWVDTNADNQMFRWSGSAWVDIRDATITAAQADASQAISDASDAQSTADGKVITFVQTSSPTAEATGDLWFDSDDNYKPYRWSGSAWVEMPQDSADWANVFGANVPEDNATVGAVVGSNLLDHAGNDITDDVITNFDDASAMGFNPTFSNWPSASSPPDGWDVYTTSTGRSRESTITLAGPYSVQFTATGAPVGLQKSVWLSYHADTVVVGSVDIYLDSRSAGNPGLIIDLIDGTSYRRAVAQADPTIIDAWQRVYFKVGPGTTPSSGTPGTYDAIRVYIMGSWAGFTGGSFTGTCYFDNFRFALLSPDIDNEHQIWSDITGSGLPEDNAAANGVDMGGMIYNSWFGIHDHERNAPAGWYPSDTTDNAAISWNDRVNGIANFQTTIGDTAVRMNSTAFRVNPNITYQLRVVLRTTSYSSTGLYIRMNEYDGTLPANRLFLAQGAIPSSFTVKGQTATRDRSALSGAPENAPVPTGWTEYTISYKPTSTAVWAGVQILNWTGHGTKGILIDRCVIEPDPGVLADLDQVTRTYTGTEQITIARYTNGTNIAIPSSAAFGTIVSATISPAESSDVALFFSCNVDKASGGDNSILIRIYDGSSYVFGGSGGRLFEVPNTPADGGGFVGIVLTIPNISTSKTYYVQMKESTEVVGTVYEPNLRLEVLYR